MGPAVTLRGGVRFRPSLVVSVTELEDTLPDAGVLATAIAAFERSAQKARRLGYEMLALPGGLQLHVAYYHAPRRDNLPGLYFVLGIVRTASKLFTMIGTTSPEVPQYREQAASFRRLMASLTVR